MNRTPDVELVLRDWLAEDDGAAPHFILDIVADRIGRQPQRRAWRLPWRHRPMNRLLLYAAAAAALTVAVLAAWRLAPTNQSTFGGPPTATPAASPSVPAAGTPLPTLDVRPCDGPSACAGALAAGVHATEIFQPAFTFTVPAGWVNGADAEWGYILYPNSPENQAEFARSQDAAQLVSAGAVDGWGDDWSICPGVITDGVATSAAEIVETLTASPNLITTTPLPVDLGGLSGHVIDVRLNPAWPGTCPLDAEDPRDKDFTEIRHRIWFLDLPEGSIVPIMIDSLSAAGFEPFLADAVPIVESFRFASTPAPS